MRPDLFGQCDVRAVHRLQVLRVNLLHGLLVLSLGGCSSTRREDRRQYDTDQCAPHHYHRLLAAHMVTPSGAQKATFAKTRLAVGTLYSPRVDPSHGAAD